MLLFRKPIHVRFLATALLGGMLFGWSGLGWAAQKQTSTPIAGTGGGPSPGAPSGSIQSSQPAPSNGNMMGYRLNQLLLEPDLEPSTVRGGAKQQRFFLPPFTEKQLVKAIKHHKKHLNRVQRRVEKRGLAFDLTPRIKAALREAGADKDFIAGLNPYTPSARARVSVHALRAESKATSAEIEAYRQLKIQSDPNERIQGAEAFAQRFPKSSLLSYVYAIQAAAYWEKNDASKVVTYSEKSLALNAHNLQALLLVSSALPQPRMLRNISDSEKEKRLSLAESYARKALQQLGQEGETQMASGVYASLGMVHLERSRMAGQQPDMVELGKAEQNYKTAIEKSQGPGNAANYFRLGEIYSMQNKLNDAIAAYSHAGQLAPGTVIELKADRDIRSLKKRKPQALKPPQP